MKKYNVPFLVYILINYLVFILINDYFYIMINKYLISILLSIFVIGIINYFIIKRINLICRFEKCDLIFFTLLLFVMAITIVYPDRSFDTFNYHLYLQEKPFVNMIYTDFFPATEMHTFSIPYADRCFYLFRLILGYRLGLIINYLLLVVIYYECKDIIKKLIPKQNVVVISLIAIMSTLTLGAVDIIDSYYVDLLSLATLVIILKNVMFRPLNVDKPYLLYLFYSVIFCFSFLIKMSNAFFLLLFSMIFIINNRKKILSTINIKCIFCILFGIVITISPYLIHTYIVTGNPVFPFYNSIFKSDYYTYTNWMDNRFGPISFLQTVAWPIYIMKNPIKANELSVIEPILTFGWITSILNMIVCTFNTIRKKEYNKDLLFLSIVHIILTFIWAKFTMGYIRYGLIIILVSVISICAFLVENILKKKYVLSGIIIAMLIYNYAYYFNYYFFVKEQWTFNNYYSYLKDNNHYKYNLKNIFARGKKIDLPEGSIWGVISPNPGLMYMLNSDVPIINISYADVTELDIKIKNEKLNSVKHIYTSVDSVNMDFFFNNIINTEYGISSTKTISNYDIIGSENSFVYVFELSKESDLKHYVEFDNNYELNTLKESKVYVGLSKESSNIINDDTSIDFQCVKNKGVKNQKITINKDGELSYVDVSDCNSIILTNNNDLNRGYRLMIIY